MIGTVDRERKGRLLFSVDVPSVMQAFTTIVRPGRRPASRRLSLRTGGAALWHQEVQPELSSRRERENAMPAGGLWESSSGRKKGATYTHGSLLW